MSNNTITLEEVIAVLEENDNVGLSITAISKKLGYSRKSAVVEDVIWNAVDAGSLVESNNGQFNVYTIPEDEDLPEEDFEDDEAMEDEEVVEEDDDLSGFDAKLAQIPVDTHGYKVAQSSDGFSVTLPNGRVHNVSAKERILVINQEKHIALTTPEDIVASIVDYANEKNITHYTITDMSLGRTITPKMINTNPVLIFIEVRRHNKAGAFA